MKLPLLIFLITAAIIFESWQYRRISNLEFWVSQIATAHNNLVAVVKEKK